MAALKASHRNLKLRTCDAPERTRIIGGRVPRDELLSHPRQERRGLGAGGRSKGAAWSVSQGRRLWTGVTTISQDLLVVSASTSQQL